MGGVESAIRDDVSSLERDLGVSHGGGTSGVTERKKLGAMSLNQLTALQKFEKDHKKLWDTRFQTKAERGIPYDPNAPQNKMIANAVTPDGRRLADSSCGELYGMEMSLNRLEQCASLAQAQRDVNKDMGKLSSVYAQFNRLMDLPAVIKAKDPWDTASANSLASKQKAAYYGDVASVYGVKETGDGKFVPDTKSGISKRADAFHKALSQRNSDLRNSVISQTQTMDSLRDTQLLNQDLAYALQDNMLKVERNIATKARLIQINNEAARKKSKAIKGILSGFIGIAVVVMAVIGKMAGWVSMREAMIGVLVGVVIVILTVYFLQENIIKAELKNMDSARKFLIKEGDELNQAALEWVDDNCDCPPDNKTHKEQDHDKEEAKKYQKLVNHLEGDTEDGIWYDDGSGPPQNISLFAFERGMKRSLKSVSEGDNPDINLSAYPDLKSDQAVIKKDTQTLQGIQHKISM